VRYTGRVFEGALLPVFLLRSGQLGSKLEKGTWRDEVKLGWQMFRKGRLALVPKFVQGKGEISSILRPSK